MLRTPGLQAITELMELAMKDVFEHTRMLLALGRARAKGDGRWVDAGH